MVRPGELNLMTAGRGVSHSEYSTKGTSILHGAQLWLALPDASRHVEPRFDHYAPRAIEGPGWHARVFLGTLLGETSPVPTQSPLLGAEVVMEPDVTIELDVDPAYEHGILVDIGEVTVEGGGAIARGELGYVEPGRDKLRLSTHGASRILLLGGEPFGEQIVMWWNFIGRDHDEVVRYREQWESLLESGADDRFSLPAGDPLEALHAPVLPNARMRPRG
jgi:redox-sensitive bicupin YhaK (pirin superfamily)